MKHLSVLFAVLILALTMGRGGVAAQDDASTDPLDDLSSLEGIQYGGMRTYSIDYEALMASAATPGAEMTMPTGVLALIGGIVEFDNDDNAEKAFDQVADEMLASITSDAENSGATPEEFDLDLGNKSKAFKGEIDEAGMKTTVAFGLIQEDEFLYVVGVTGSEIDAEQLTKDFGKKMIDEDASDDDVQFNEDGTSTGGVWDKFPDSDDDLVKDLIPSDEQLYPEVAE